MHRSGVPAPKAARSRPNTGPDYCLPNNCSATSADCVSRPPPVGSEVFDPAVNEGFYCACKPNFFGDPSGDGSGCGLWPAWRAHADALQ